MLRVNLVFSQATRSTNPAMIKTKWNIWLVEDYPKNRLKNQPKNKADRLMLKLWDDFFCRIM